MCGKMAADLSAGYQLIRSQSERSSAKSGFRCRSVSRHRFPAIPAARRAGLPPERRYRMNRPPPKLARSAILGL